MWGKIQNHVAIILPSPSSPYESIKMACWFLPQIDLSWIFRCPRRDTHAAPALELCVIHLSRAPALSVFWPLWSSYVLSRPVCVHMCDLEFCRLSRLLHPVLCSAPSCGSHSEGFCPQSVVEPLCYSVSTPGFLCVLWKLTFFLCLFCLPSM